ncbi:MAG: S53 family peptidase [Verrucomicrobia bacterium]|nr:S53 family peptidase [Verrucomicrobiota bacterium]
MSSPQTPDSAETDFVPLRGTYRQPPRGRRMGPADPNDAVTVTVDLRRARPLPSFGQSGTQTPLVTAAEREAYGRTYGASEADIETVLAYARSVGLEAAEISIPKRRLRLTGPVSAMERAFRVKLSNYQPSAGGDPVRARLGVISVPRHLAEIITGVQGLDRRPFARSHARLGRRQPAETAPPVYGDPSDPFTRGFTGADLAALYNFPARTSGRGQTIALIQLGGQIDEAEIARYFGQLGIERDPALLVVRGRPERELGDDPGADLEIALDVQVAGAAAPEAKIVVYFAADRSQDSFRNVLLDVVHDTEHCPNIISISWGGPETESTGQFRQRFHETLETARRFGITVIAASGDYGSADYRFSDGGWDGHAHVDHPAADPLVLACGGTELRNAGAGSRRFTEVVWSIGRNHGTGGGVSRLYPLPDYQERAGVPAARNPAGPVRRGVPDVAANASGDSGYLVLCNGQWFPDYTQGVPKVSGTSAGAPLWAALIARLNEALGRPLGLVQPRFYALPADAGAFDQIVDGNNGDYSAGPGWNPCTGLGVPDGEGLLAALRSAPEQTRTFERLRRQPVRRAADEGGSRVAESEGRAAPRGGGGDPGGSNIDVRGGGGDPGGSNIDVRGGGGDPGGSNIDVRGGGGDPGGSN